jgi:hypothetical protein
MQMNLSLTVTFLGNRPGAVQNAVRAAPLSSVVVIICALTGAAILHPARVSAQTDEIQVYDAGHAEPGVVNLTVHTNFTPKGITTPAFPGAIVADHSLNGVPEWAYGVTSWFEAGLYLPLYTHDKNTGWEIDGFKLRALFAVPNADERKFVYGVNFEFSVNAQRWDASRTTSEVRPILGWHLHRIDVIINPILDTSYNGIKNLEFVPATRLAYRVHPKWQVGVEEYDDFGRVSGFLPLSSQAHQLYVVTDHSGAIDVQAGIGFGLTSGSDRITLKLILSGDLNKPRTTAVHAESPSETPSR